MKIMIGFRVTSEFKDFLQKLADEENRNLSNFMENAILTYIKEHKEIDYKKEIKPKKTKKGVLGKNHPGPAEKI
jgi:predicted transcriptional regulator